MSENKPKKCCQYREHTPMHSFHIPHGNFGIVMWNNLNALPHRLEHALHAHDNSHHVDETQQHHAPTPPSTATPTDEEKHKDAFAATTQPQQHVDEHHNHDEHHHEEEHKDTNAMLDAKVPGVRYPNLLVRLLVLVLLFLMVSGAIISYNMVAALSSKYAPSFSNIWFRMMKEYNVSDTQMGILYSVYSFPNIVTVFLAGLLIDKIGINIVCIICISTVIAGNLVTLGNSYWFILVGRVIYGLGAESMGVIQASLVARWFSFDRTFSLAFASACTLLSFRCNPFMSMFAFPALAETTSLFVVIVIVNVIVLISGAACIGMIILDKIYEKYLHLHDHATPEVKQSRLKALANCIKLPFTYWVAVALSVFFYSSIFSYVSFANRFMENKFGFTTSTSSALNSIMYGLPIVLMVPSGILVDRVGHRLSFTCVGMSTAVVAFALLAFTNVTPWVAVSLLGIAFAVVPAVIIPLLALIVDETKLGVAYGLKMAIQNAFLSIIPVVIGLIPQYEYKVILNFGLMVAALVLTLLLLLIDLIFMHGKIEFTRIKTSHKTSKKSLCCIRLHEQILTPESPKEDKHPAA